MTRAALIAAAAVLGIAGPVLAAPKQPPMNDFNSAFYRCAGADGGAFNIDYDGQKPKGAVMRTSQQARYELKREKSADGFLFKGEGVSFWTDGESTKVEGGKQAYADCKRES